MNRAWFWIGLPIVFLCVVGAVSQHKPKHAKPKPKSTAKTRRLKAKLESVKTERAKIRTRLRATERKVNAVSTDIDAVDQRLDLTAERLAQTQDELERDRARQTELTGLLGEAEAKVSKDTEAVRTRLRNIYMEGDAPTIAVFLGSATSGDIASRTYLLDRVASADKRVLDEYKNQRDVLAQETREAETLVVRIRQNAEEQQSREAELEATRSEKADILQNLQDQKGELQELLDQFEKDESSIEQQILAAERTTGHASLPSHFAGRLHRPINAPITSGFGMRFHPILHKMRLHAGIDFGAPTGAAIHAAADGVVVNAQYMRGFGNTVIIDHGGGIATVYGHCSKLLVRAGQHVHQGDRIANVGSTGLATGPHLHFEVHVRGHAVDPRGWL